LSSITDIYESYVIHCQSAFFALFAIHIVCSQFEEVGLNIVFSYNNYYSGYSELWKMDIEGKCSF